MGIMDAMGAPLPDSLPACCSSEAAPSVGAPEPSPFGEGALDGDAISSEPELQPAVVRRQTTPSLTSATTLGSCRRSSLSSMMLPFHPVRAAADATAPFRRPRHPHPMKRASCVTTTRAAVSHHAPQTGTLIGIPLRFLDGTVPGPRLGTPLLILDAPAAKLEEPWLPPNVPPFGPEAHTEGEPTPLPRAGQRLWADTSGGRMPRL